METFRGTEVDASAHVGWHCKGAARSDLARVSRRKFLFLVFLAFALAEARGDWTVRERERDAGTNEAVTRFAIKLEETASRETVQLQLAVFDSAKATLRVFDQPDEPRGSLAAAMRAGDFLAGVNGGYFDPEHAAVGLLISDGRVVQAKQKARLLSGVVSVVSGRLQIQRAAAYAPKGKPSAARQCGPFLVERGRVVAGLNDTRGARRTFVLVGEKGRAAIGYASSVTLAELGALLATPALAPELNVQSALNLDGGSSSGFWFAGAEGAFSIREQKTVRDFIGIVAKP